MVGADERRDEDALRGGPARGDRLGAGRRGRGHAPPHARELRPAGADPDARRGGEPQRVGGGGRLPVRIGAPDRRERRIDCKLWLRTDVLIGIHGRSLLFG